MAAIVQAAAAAVTAVADVAGVLPTVTFLSLENVKEIYKELKEQLDSLRAKKKDCDDEAKRYVMTMRTSCEYDDWKRRFELTNIQVTKSLISYATKIPNIHQLMTDAHQRMNLGETMGNDINKIKNLKKELTEMQNILVAKQADHVVKISPTPDIRDFETLEKPMNTILSLLKMGKDVKGIQIHGLLGTGKTTIMQNLNNHEEVANMFQIIIWLKVSSDTLDTIGNKKNFSVEELQKDVMQRLNLDDSIQVNQYRRSIWEKLKDTKYLLLLDNVKEYISIEEIGFPDNWERGSKILLTTRYKRVCPSIVDQSIKVGLLTLKEARRMFSNILKPKDFTDNPFIMKPMRKAVDWCRGLPVAIKIVAGYFRLCDDEDSWRNGLKNLNSWPEYGDDEIKEMCRSLSFCCDYLQGAEKDCFYYGTLYPEESSIRKDRLLDCWMAEDLLGHKGERGHGRAYGQRTLERLNDLNLFEEDERKICVWMHKLIRLVALHNLQTDERHKCLVLSNEKSLDQQNMDSWTEKHWISLTDNKNLKIFSNSPDCSKLSTLFLQGNSNLKMFPPSFFKQMGSLRVLDLMGTSIKSIPDSLINAKKLAVLYLNECTNLLKLPSEIGNLELLEVLDISGSGIENVAPQIQSLKNLKRFLVSSGAFSETNIFNVISDLTELQEMLIDTKSKKETYDWGILDAVMESVKTLKHITSLQFRFLNDEVVDVIKVVDCVTRIYAHKGDDLKYFVEGLEYRSFQVFIGCLISPDVKIPKCVRYERYVKYCNGKDRSPTVLKLLSKSDALVIANHDNLEHLSEFEFSNLSAIRGCLLEHCNKFKYIAGHFSIPSKLERLYLNDLPELESLWGGSIHPDNLPKLKTLKLSRCPKFIKIVTKDAVKDIIQISHNAGEKPIAFPNLKEVILVDMPHLTSIWENELLEWPALKTVEISKCLALHHLPFSKDNAIKLTSITAEETWWEALQWTDHATKQHFQKHCTFGRGILPNTPA